MIFEEKSCLSLKAENETSKKNKLLKNPKEALHNFENTQDSISPQNNDINNNISSKEENGNQLNVGTFYIKKLSEQTILKYGALYFKSFCAKENDVLPENFMKKHKISSFIRSKMVNWMIEIFYTFNSNEETFLAAVDIMDKYIYNCHTKVLTDDDIHLLGVVSVYIASKVYDLIPIQIDNIIHQIGHDQFTLKQILKMERSIIKAINFDVFSSNSFDLIRFLIYDFYVNNKSKFVSLKAEKYMDMLINNSIWIYQMCKHYEKYSSVRPLFLSLSCLLIGYDIIRDNCEDFNGETKTFFKNWLTFLFNQFGKSHEIKKQIESIYKNIQKSYNDYKNSTFKNLAVFHEIYFD